MSPTVPRLVSALGISLPAALIASFPAAVRCSASATSSVGLVSAWPALAGALLLPMTAAIVVLRGARAGLADLAGERPSRGGATAEPFEPLTTAGLSELLEPTDAATTPIVSADLPDLPDEHVPPRASLLGGAFLGWGALLCAGLAPVGALLRARTHHHGLAGVTFALVALLLALGLALVVRRALELVTASTAQVQRVALGAFFTALGLAVLLLAVVGGLRSGASAGSTDSGALALVPAALTANALTLDVLAFVLAAAFASRPLRGAGAKKLDRVWLASSVAALALVVLGAGSLGRVDGLQDELARSSPFFALAAPAPTAPAVPDAPAATLPSSTD